MQLCAEFRSLNEHPPLSVTRQTSFPVHQTHQHLFVDDYTYMSYGPLEWKRQNSGEAPPYSPHIAKGHVYLAEYVQCLKERCQQHNLDVKQAQICLRCDCPFPVSTASRVKDIFCSDCQHHHRRPGIGIRPAISPPTTTIPRSRLSSPPTRTGAKTRTNAIQETTTTMSSTIITNDLTTSVHNSSVACETSTTINASSVCSSSSSSSSSSETSPSPTSSATNSTPQSNGIAETAVASTPSSNSNEIMAQAQTNGPGTTTMTQNSSAGVPLDSNQNGTTSDPSRTPEVEREIREELIYGVKTLRRILKDEEVFDEKALLQSMSEMFQISLPSSVLSTSEETYRSPTVTSTPNPSHDERPPPTPPTITSRIIAASADSSSARDTNSTVVVAQSNDTRSHAQGRKSVKRTNPVSESVNTTTPLYLSTLFSSGNSDSTPDSNPGACKRPRPDPSSLSDNSSNDGSAARLQLTAPVSSLFRHDRQRPNKRYFEEFIFKRYFMFVSFYESVVKKVETMFTSTHCLRRAISVWCTHSPYLTKAIKMLLSILRGGHESRQTLHDHSVSSFVDACNPSLLELVAIFHVVLRYLHQTQLICVLKSALTNIHSRRDVEFLRLTIIMCLVYGW